MISIIVAMGRNRAIGKAGALPWHLPADLARFKRLTMGHPIIMGRKTFESIGRALPGRTNIVVTRNLQMCEVSLSTLLASGLQEATELARKSEGATEIFIIGGGQIFSQAITLADRLYVTEIDVMVSGADSFFPVVDDKIWQEISRESFLSGPGSEYAYSFITYERRGKK